MTARSKDEALSRAARVQAVSIILRAGHPVLLALATRMQGLASFGAFLASQGVVFVVARVCLLGLDRALLVTAPRFAAEGRIPAARAVRVVAKASAIGAIGVALFLMLFAKERSLAFVIVAALGVVPVALGELLAQTAIARGRFTQTTLLREALAPMLAIGLVFVPIWPTADDGLAFTASFGLASLLSMMLLGALVFSDTSIERRPSGALPRELSRVARGALLADGVATIAQRLDVVVLGLVASPALVGTYGVLSQFGQTLRSLRSGLEPVVQSRVALGDVREGVSRDATVDRTSARDTVLRLQIPLAFVFVLFRAPLLGFFGVHGADAELALVVLTYGHVASTWLAFEVAILHGRGRGVAVAAALAAGALTQAVLVVALVPHLGLVGASIATAVSVIVPGLVALLARRSRTPSSFAHEVTS